MFGLRTAEVRTEGGERDKVVKARQRKARTHLIWLQGFHLRDCMQSTVQIPVF